MRDEIADWPDRAALVELIVSDRVGPRSWRATRRIIVPAVCEQRAVLMLRALYPLQRVQRGPGP